MQREDERKKRRLKDKIWNACHIKIDRLVKQETDGVVTTNVTIMYLVKIKTNGKWQTMFNVKNRSELWKKIKEESCVL